MTLSPDDPPLMIAQWRQLAALYHAEGNAKGEQRTTRLADQLEQMLEAGTVTYSGPTSMRAKQVPDVRYCRRCTQTLPLTHFPRDPRGPEGVSKYCHACFDKPPTKSPVNTRKKKEPKPCTQTPET